MKRKNMTKADLKTGMVVEFRDGKKGMILESVGEFGTLIQFENGWTRLSNYSDNLKSFSGNEALEIISIYRPCYEYQIAPVSWGKQELIWERQKPKPMTIEEISEALGYPVKIKEGR